MENNKHLDLMKTVSENAFYDAEDFETKLKEHYYICEKNSGIELSPEKNSTHQTEHEKTDRHCYSENVYGELPQIPFDSYDQKCDNILPVQPEECATPVTSEITEDDFSTLEVLINNEIFKEKQKKKRCLELIEEIAETTNHNSTVHMDDEHESKMNCKQVKSKIRCNELKRQRKYCSIPRSSTSDSYFKNHYETPNELTELELEIEKMLQISELKRNFEKKSTTTCEGTALFGKYQDISQKKRLVRHPKKHYHQNENEIAEKINFLSNQGPEKIGSDSLEKLAYEGKKYKPKAFHKKVEIKNSCSLASRRETLTTDSESEEIETLVSSERSKITPVYSVEISSKFNQGRTNSFHKYHLSSSSQLPTILSQSSIKSSAVKVTDFVKRSRLFSRISDKSNTKQKNIKSKGKCLNRSTMSTPTDNGSKKSMRKLSSFHRDQVNKTSMVNHSRSALKTEEIKQKHNLADGRKSAKDGTRRINLEKIEDNIFKTSSKGVKLYKSTDSAKFVGNSKTNTLCRMSLIVEQLNKDDDFLSHQEIIESLKEHFWCTDVNKEKILIQMALIYLEHSLRDTRVVVNGKFKLYCSEEISPVTVDTFTASTEYELNKSSLSISEPNLRCPLYIETILSKSQVNRLMLESSILSDELDLDDNETLYSDAKRS